MFRKIFQKYIYWLSKLVLWRFRPRIIAITGNVGKTSTKEAVLAVLSAKFRVRGPEKNFNNEFGVPLTILGWPNYRKNIFGWFWASIAYPFLLAGVFKYPRILILEMGADRPGDIDYLTKLARPDIGVVTAVGNIPVHVEFFDSPETLAAEKAVLVERTNPKGFIILNADDRQVLAMRSSARARVMLYGISQNADIRVENIEAHLNLESGNTTPGWLTFKISDKGAVVPVHLNDAINPVQSMAAAAAYAVGKTLGMNSVEIASALNAYKPPAGRTKIIKGTNGSIILDDTYNAAPSAVEAALATLKIIPAERRIAVLGNMAELGEYSVKAHRDIGKLTAEICDVLIAVGDKANIIREEASLKGINTHWVETSREVAALLLPIISEGDVILVKGAQSMRMEKVVEDIMAEPQKAKDLLVRQSADWKQKY